MMFMEEYDDEDMDPRVKEAYVQLNAHCSPDHSDRKVVGHRPCHKRFTLYKLELNVVKQNSDRLYGNVSGCNIQQPLSPE